jgi:hypothetical protein
MLAITIETRDAPIERGHQVAQPSAQVLPFIVG